MNYNAASWWEIISTSFQNLWLSFSVFLPRLIGALLVLIIGWALAAFVGRLIATIIGSTHVDELIEKLKVAKRLEHVGAPLKVGGLIGWIVRWFIILVVFITAVDVLGWTQVNVFLNTVVEYLPNVVVAVIILLAGFVVAHFVHDVVEKTVRVAKLHAPDFLAGLAKWAIIIFSFAAALVQLGVASELIQILFSGLVALIALAGGLAFGLGGRDTAAKLLERMRKDLTE